MQQGAKWSVQNTTRLAKDETFLNVAGHIKQDKRKDEKGGQIWLSCLSSDIIKEGGSTRSYHELPQGKHA